MRRALAAGLSIAAVVVSLVVLTAPGAAATAPNAIAATGSTCFVSGGKCSEVPCVEMIIGGSETAMAAGSQPVPSVRPATSRCVRPPASGTGTLSELSKAPSFAPPGFRGALAQGIAALSRAVMRSLGGLDSP